MEYPFSVSCTERADGLIELSDGRFQLIAGGAITPFMSGPDYVLVEHELADFLRMQQIQDAALTPAVLWRRRVDEEFDTHCRLIVGRRFSSSDIRTLPLDGKRLYLMNNTYLFASPMLKAELEAAGFDYLCFGPGLTGFYG